MGLGKCQQCPLLYAVLGTVQSTVSMARLHTVDIWNLRGRGIEGDANGFRAP